MEGEKCVFDYKVEELYTKIERVGGKFLSGYGGQFDHELIGFSTTRSLITAPSMEHSVCPASIPSMNPTEQSEQQIPGLMCTGHRLERKNSAVESLSTPRTRVACTRELPLQVNLF